MGETTRVELPLVAHSKVLSYKTLGNLKAAFPSLSFVKYIYRDPIDGALKGQNPPDDLLLFPNAYITVVGEMSNIIKFAEQATMV
jgi:hypothetical protein